MLGFRAWKVSAAGTLHSPLVNYLWSRDSNAAHCAVTEVQHITHTDRKPYGSPPCDDPPGRDCACGLYCYPLPKIGPISFLQPENVIGLVSGYGRVIEHADGVVRCQSMTVLALCSFARFPAEYYQDADDAYSVFAYGYGVPNHIVPPPDRIGRAADNLGVPWGAFATLGEALAFLLAEASRYPNETVLSPGAD